MNMWIWDGKSKRRLDRGLYGDQEEVDLALS